MAKVTWIGNEHTRELHRVEANKPQPVGCQLDEIPKGHRVVFKTARLALTGVNLSSGRKQWNYDACAYCNKHFKSRR